MFKHVKSPETYVHLGCYSNFTFSVSLYILPQSHSTTFLNHFINSSINPFLHSSHLVVVELQFVNFVEQTLDISHAEKLGDERLDFELFQVVDVFPGSDEYHGRLGSRHTARVSVR